MPLPDTQDSTMAVAFYSAAFLISLTCLIYSLIQGRLDKLHKKIYLWMLGILIGNTVTEIIAVYVTPLRMESAAAYLVMSLCRYLYFVVHTMLLPLLVYYVLSVTGLTIRLNRRRHFLLCLPVFIMETLFSTNPWLPSPDPSSFHVAMYFQGHIV